MTEVLVHRRVLVFGYNVGVRCVYFATMRVQCAQVFGEAVQDCGPVLFYRPVVVPAVPFDIGG